MPVRTVPGICRNCLAYCPIVVTVEDGRAVAVTGDRDAPRYEGYTCPKGRALPAQHNDPARLLRPLARDAGGALAPVTSAAAVAGVAARVQDLLARHGPNAVALYTGTGVVSHPSGPALAKAWFRAIGSPLTFSAATIDKPAANISTALHGNWVAGAQPFETADTWMIVGANPVIAKSNGAPPDNPGQRIKDAIRRGMKLIVIDPRQTETARRAHIHLQARPGEDATVLAALIRIILDEHLHDAEFVAQNARGLALLAERVAPFTPEYASRRADVPVELLREAARTFAAGCRGGVVCSTGPSFATHGNLVYYLALCLNTLCGRWARAGDPAPQPNVLLPAFVPKAQPYPPYPVFGARKMHARGLRENASGLPTAALADEILHDGEDRIRALFCIGGNPLLSWPDQARTRAALERLELLVVSDYRMTPTARHAHFVIPPPLSLEMPGSTAFVEALKYNGVTRGFEVPWAQYTPAIAEVPAGSDLMDESAFFFRLAQAMGLQLDWVNVHGYGPHVESPKRSVPLDMTREPSVDELVALAVLDARIPLDEVRRHPHGAVFDAARATVAPRDPDCTAMLELADPLMMAELDAVHAAAPAPERRDGTLRLICRRANRTMNSMGQEWPSPGGMHPGNPLHMHPARMAALGLAEGQRVEVVSSAGSLVAPLQADATLRADTVSLTHGWAGPADDGSQDGGPGLSATRLVDLAEADPVSGIPRMSAIPVRVRAIAGLDDERARSARAVAAVSQ